MKKLQLLALLVGFGLLSCDNDDEGAGPNATTANFTVTIENVSTPKSLFASGAIPGGLGPGSEQEFTFEAGPSTLPGTATKLSLVTMFVESNDLFFAPGEAGIALYDNGIRVTGDITDQIDLWDAGTEVNEEPGTGANQPMRQAGPNTGTDENGTIELVANVNDGFTYPAVSDLIEVTIEALPTSETGFKVVVKNISGSSTLPTPIAGLVWVVHTEDAPLFTVGQADRGEGLETIAEDGDNTGLASITMQNTGLVVPLSPGVWAVHDQGIMPLFTSDQADLGEGLIAIAEDGDPSGLATALQSKSGVSSSGIFNTAVGGAGPGAIGPGGSYSFSISATDGDYLSFATMFVQSNDLFYSPSQSGVVLFNNGAPISGDIMVALYDVGSEVNELPGAGLNQVIRQAGPNTGADENGIVTNISNVNDGFTYPNPSEVIKVTIASN